MVVKVGMLYYLFVDDGDYGKGDDWSGDLVDVVVIDGVI